jgi:CBS domain containing-hemolysin-like protein
MPLPAAVLALIPSILDFVLGEAKEVIDRTVPDREAADKAKRALEEKRHDNSVTLAMQQILANVAEIQSGHILGKWRGALGWGLAFSAIYQLVLIHFITSLILVFNPAFPVEKLPKLEWAELGKILMGMLGIV